MACFAFPHRFCFLPATVVVVVLLNALGRAIAVGVVVFGALVADVVLVVHVLRGLLGVALRLELVVLVHALGLGQLIDLTADKAGEEFLGELVGYLFACGIGC